MVDGITDYLKNTPNESEQISRRNFLKLSGLGLLAAILPTNGKPQQLSTQPSGRVIYPSIKVFDIPSFSGESVRLYWQDAVVPISAVSIGDEEPAYNRIWYKIGDLGYAHSGGIQPVIVRLNEPIANIPRDGILAEVTVPFTDAVYEPDKKDAVAYRFYYETTHWVTGLVESRDGKPWYRILDDKWEFLYYVPAEHIRLIYQDELKPRSRQVPLNAKRLEVRIGDQMVLAYEHDRLVWAARAATGARFSNGNYSTPGGRHMTFHKRPSRHMARGNLAYNGFDLPGVPWVCYITKSGIAIHGTYWHNDYGKPRSHGCINLAPRAAKWVYQWTLPVVPPYEQRVYEGYGTVVDVI
jgi:hypothetical protein